MNLKINKLKPENIECAQQIFVEAFGASMQAGTKVKVAYNLAPQGWLIAQVNDIPVGLVASFCFGNVVYIGFMSVKTAYQKIGIGSSLMKAIIALYPGKTFLLDSSATGLKMYRGLGFKEIDKTWTYKLERSKIISNGSTKTATIVQAIKQYFTPICEYDRSVYEYDRSLWIIDLLKRYQDKAFVALAKETKKVMGFIIVQDQQIGPFIAEDVNTAITLLEVTSKKLSDDTFLVIIPESNISGQELFATLGEKKRSNTHMTLLGKKKLLYLRRQNIFGQISLAVG